MKIKDLFKKVETLNQLNHELGMFDETIKVHYSESNFSSHEFATYKEFKKWVESEYIEQFQQPLLNCEIEGNEGLYTGKVEYRDYFGNQSSNIEIRVY